MYAFNDKAGRKWTIDITFGTIVRVHKETGINLRTLVDGDEKNPLEPCFEFVSDPMSFGPALCCILADQLKEHKLTVEQFMESLDGDAAEAAGHAFVRAYIGFFHPSKKDALHEMLGKALELQEKATNLAVQRMKEMDLDKLVAARTAMLSNSSSGSAPASSDSTLAPSLSANL